MDIKDNILAIIMEQYLPTDEESSSGILTSAEIQRMTEDSIKLSLDEITEAFLEEGYILGMFEKKIGFWYKKSAEN